MINATECALCPWAEIWSTEHAAQSAAVWHVVREHPEVWRMIAGGRAPYEPRPETLGDRLFPSSGRGPGLPPSSHPRPSAPDLPVPEESP